MDIALSVTLGLLFLITGFASVFLMFRLWGWPDGHHPGMSLAPPHLVRLQRIFFYVHIALYLMMMLEMVPRLWHYQVELPPRTAMHVCLGFFIGGVLLVQLAFTWVFRHLEMWIPMISTVHLGCTVLLLGLSIPGGLREFGLARGTVGGGVYSIENRARVASLLPLAEMPAEAPLPELSTAESLRAGREVLATKCVICHDLKTVLVQPRAPAGWWKTVERMAEKPSFTDPMTEREQWEVTAYLIAITGDLQRSVRERRQQELKQAESIVTAVGAVPGAAPTYDAAAAEKAYENVCAQCHELSDVDKKPPTTAKEVKEVIERMVTENGMTAPQTDLELIYAYMIRKFAPGEVATAPPTLSGAAAAAGPAGEKKVEAALAEAKSADAVADPDKAVGDEPGEGLAKTMEGNAPAAPAKPGKAAAKPGKAPAIDGRPLYSKYCASCHDGSGKGKPAMKSKGIPDLTAKAWQKKHSKGSIASAVKNGVPGSVMKAFSSKMKPEEIDAVAAFVKKLR